MSKHFSWNAKLCYTTTDYYKNYGRVTNRGKRNCEVRQVLTVLPTLGASKPCPDGFCSLLTCSSCPCEFPPVFFSSLALLNITVNPSAEAGSLTSHSPNLGRGLPFSYLIWSISYHMSIQQSMQVHTDKKTLASIYFADQTNQQI